MSICIVTQQHIFRPLYDPLPRGPTIIPAKNLRLYYLYSDFLLPLITRLALERVSMVRTATWIRVCEWTVL